MGFDVEAAASLATASASADAFWALSAFTAALSTAAAAALAPSDVIARSAQAGGRTLMTMEHLRSILFFALVLLRLQRLLQQQRHFPTQRSHRGG